MAVKPIPDGYSSVTPYLIVDGAAKAIEFYAKSFGATVIMRMDGPEGKVGHAELQIGDSVVMLADEAPGMGFRSPKTLGGTPISILQYVENADGVVERALAAGATVIRPIADQFYGDRSATIEDPFGHVWVIATHIEDVPPEEMAKRAEAAMKQKPA